MDSSMEPGKFNVLMDLQFGSCGKGKFAPWLAREFRAQHLSCSNRPNAGHTSVIGDQVRVYKVLPSACALMDEQQHVWLSSGSAFYIDRITDELGMFTGILHIHPQAEVVRDEDKLAEMATTIASTHQGSMGSLLRKLLRRDWDSVVPRDAMFSLQATGFINHQHMWLHESSQGWGLSLDHGIYPYVTTRNCGTAAALDQMGLSPRLLGDVYGIFRPYPIRVGNLPGQTSGPGWAGSPETTWEHIANNAGLDGNLRDREQTTVTKRTRRVFEFSMEQIQDAVRMNGVNRLILNFAQYLDRTAAGRRGPMAALPSKVLDFIDRVQVACNVPVVAVGTGADIDDVCVRL